ncbi:malectin domain-containing carbohydrate-binding protein [Micromonospora sp. R77]|uniref:cellulase family glycosylhydrolase n=1 Tax=Micromonospora sp. R77 TaxID=2925836 RepID=UPI001F60DF12|nr:cellulase family glycosylhydrolase [Micromonospora sp. R77]MCI4066240.1 malectin domain-containing carbohydrate-binding protein [Micromonospora sp. R77]
MLSVNAGGAASGAFVADAYFTGGTAATHANPIDVSGVNTPAPTAVYQTERYGAFSYTLPGLAAGGAYTLRLHFAETYFTTAGQRQFNTSVNGQQVLTNFDIVGAAGGANKALVRDFPATATGGGQIVVAFTNGAANNAKVDGIEVVPAGTPPPTVVRVEAGGTSAFTDTNGDVWAADNGFTGGATVDRGAVAIANTTNPRIFQTERYGMSAYTFAVPNGTYTVKLLFAETYAGITGAGQRVFNVDVEGTAMNNIDIYAAVGPDAALTRTATVTVADGRLDIGFTAVAQTPLLNGIEITGGGAPPPAPTAPGGLTATASATAASVALNWTASSTAGVIYRVYRSTSPGVTASAANLVTCTTTAATGCVDDTVRAATKYYYVVTAVNGTSESAASNEASATTATGAHRVGVVTQYGQLRVAGAKLVDKSGTPVQLKGMSAHQLQFYPWTTATVDNLVTQYHNSLVRAAMYVEEGGYATDPAGMKAKVRTIVDAAIANDVYVIVDWHLVGGNPLNWTAQAKAFFQDISVTYRSTPNVIYEIYNEPTSDWGSIRDYANQVIPVIRANAPNSVVVVGTPNYDSAPQDAWTNPLTIGNVMYSLHFYCGQNGDGQRGNVAGLIAKGMPVFVTEWGTSDYTGDGGPYPTEAQKWLDFMTTNKISWANWSLTTKNEGSAFLKPTSSLSGPWTDSDLSPAGLFMRTKF